MSKEAMKLWLEALENSLDLVSHEAREAEKMYANVPTRLARVQGFVALEVAHEKAITTLREALAEQHEMTNIERHERNVKKFLAEQPAQQEPEQSKIFCGVDFADGMLSVSVLRRRADDVAELLHAEQIELPAQRTWVGLTFAEICECETDYLHIFARAIEAKLKEKNT